MEEIEEMKHKMLPYSPSPPSSPQTSRPASPANETEETMRAAAAVRIQNIGRQKSAKKRVDKIRAKRAEAEANVAERAEEVVGGAKMPEEKAAEAVEEETAEPAVETVPRTRASSLQPRRANALAMTKHCYDRALAMTMALVGPIRSAKRC